MYSFMFLALYISSRFNFVEPATILAYFPAPLISHQVVFRPITQELARRGHKVIVLTPDPAFPKGKTPENLTELDVGVAKWKKFLVCRDPKYESDIIGQTRLIHKTILAVLESELNVPEFKKVLDEKPHVDLILVESCAAPVGLFLVHTFDVPVIEISSFGAALGNYENIGAPVHPLHYPTCVSQRIYNLTLWEKFTEVYINYLVHGITREFSMDANKWTKMFFGENKPDLEELFGNINMLVLNMHPVWAMNHPVSKNVQYMWGVHQVPRMRLPEDLQAYLDSSKQGVIYMSFGTNTNPSALPPEKIHMFIKVFSSLQYNVLWKWDSDELPGRPDNVRISTWFPQSDLLRHPNVKVFITQGGLQSTDEAIAAGVPLVGIPLLGDQWYNTEQYPHHGIGVKLDLDALTEETFKGAIERVIRDDSYRINIIKLRSIMQDEPQSAVERAIWAIEYVLRHGDARHLKSALANITWREYFEVDLFAILLLGLVGVCVLCSSVLYLVLRIIDKSIPKRKEE